MASTIDTEQLLKLSAEKRLALISLLWDSLTSEDAPVDVDDATWAESERRFEELKKHPERGISHEEMCKRRGWTG